jgi:hypothetical protein
MVINSHVNERFKSYWMGHKAGLGLDSRYYDPKNPDSRDALLKEYLKAADLLTINNEHRLKRENIKLKAEVNEVQLLKAQMQKQTEEMAHYKKRSEQMDDIIMQLGPAIESLGLARKDAQESGSQPP